MKLVDANVLIYAVDPSAEHHEASRTWLDSHLVGPDTVMIPWASLLAFLRVTTNPRIRSRPLSVDIATAVVDDWLSLQHVAVPEPDSLHNQRIRQLLTGAGRAGNLVTDAHLAALAIQWDATVVTFDTDFALFPGVKWEVPRVAEA